MKPAVFYECGDASQIQVAEVPMPQVAAGQALIRVQVVNRLNQHLPPEQIPALFTGAMALLFALMGVITNIIFGLIGGLIGGAIFQDKAPYAPAVNQ